MAFCCLHITKINNASIFSLHPNSLLPKSFVKNESFQIKKYVPISNTIFPTKKDFRKNQLGFWSSILNIKLKLISLHSMEALVIILEASDSTEIVRLQTLSERTLDRTQSSRSLPAEYV